MRAPNYKVGWLVDQKLAALTHYHPNITPEDIMGVYTESHNLLEGVTTPFHLFIDNRLAPFDKIYTLSELLEMSPLLRHPYLSHIVVVKPNHLKLYAIDVVLQTQAQVSLQNVDSVQDGISFLKQHVGGLEDENIYLSFFPA